MFVIELTYKAPLAAIDAHMAEHVVFLRKYYASGNFLVSPEHSYCSRAERSWEASYPNA